MLQSWNRRMIYRLWFGASFISFMEIRYHVVRNSNTSIGQEIWIRDEHRVNESSLATVFSSRERGESRQIENWQANWRKAKRIVTHQFVAWKRLDGVGIYILQYQQEVRAKIVLNDLEATLLFLSSTFEAKQW